ncbi:hypothetical protein KOEU_32800 [Komagataeibacter europaeus]|uniref:Uncharacterized protein n=1 Tax=Komagataeibacter europaeus TaxID=33995 RepID=A0A0M0ED87_KOMEU|nr:hypothetical protein KOEU_32800 [Komagataeibacter europaeus]
MFWLCVPSLEAVRTLVKIFQHRNNNNVRYHYITRNKVNFSPEDYMNLTSHEIHYDYSDIFFIDGFKCSIKCLREASCQDGKVSKHIILNH